MPKGGMGRTVVLADSAPIMGLIQMLAGVLRGDATRPQIYIACALGAMLGFVPGFFLPGDLGGGFMQAPALILSLFALALVLNTNLGVFGLAAFLAKVLSFALLPVSVWLGRAIVDGPLQPMFASAVQTPWIAWFGLERYATTGGLVLGLAFGLLQGFAWWRTVHALRVRLAAAEERDAKFLQVAARKPVRFATWLLVGSGKGKTSWQDLADKDARGSIVRWAGIIAVLVLGVGLYFGHGYLGRSLFKSATQDGLAAWNGATVDLDDALLDLFGGEVSLSSLAMADVHRLDTNVFAARSLQLDVGTGAMLAGRFEIERLSSTEAESGTGRQQPGEIIGTPPPQPPPPPAGPGGTLEDYVAEAQRWKQRLETVADWIERFTGDAESVEAETETETDAEREAREAEMAYVERWVSQTASHLLREVPAVVVRELVFDSVVAAGLDGDVIDIKGSNLASHPHLLDAPMTLQVTSRSGSFAFNLEYDPASGKGPQLGLDVRNVEVEALKRLIPGLPLRGGHLDFSMGGNLAPADDAQRSPWIDLPLKISLQDSNLLFDGRSTPLAPMRFPIGLRGPVAGPRIWVDTDAFSDQLIAQGRKELATRFRGEASKLLGNQFGELGNAVGDLIDGSGTTSELVEQAAEQAQKELTERAGEELKKQLGGQLEGQLGGALKGLLGGARKKESGAGKKQQDPPKEDGGSLQQQAEQLVPQSLRGWLPSKPPTGGKK